VTDSRVAPRRHLVRASVAWGIFGFALLVSIANLVAVEASVVGLVTYAAIPLTFGGIGAFLSTRVPGNPIGPILLVTTLGFTTLIASWTWLWTSVELPTNDPFAILVGLLTEMLFIPSLVLVLVGVPLLFPDGRFLSPRWRWVAIASALTVAVATVRILFETAELAGIPGLRNPFFLAGAEGILGTIDQVETLVGVPLFLLAVWSLVLRYRRSGDVARHQIRWLVAASAVAVVAFGFSFVLPPDVAIQFQNIGIIALNAIPLAIGVAIVRYRLYDIDRLISRGISYGLVTLVLLLTYVAVVLFLQGPLGAMFGTQTVTVAISTLVVAGLFQPVRSRIQRAVDHRFDRARVDTERTATAFSDRLREQVDIDAVVGDLAATASGAVRPAQIDVWLREPAVPS
jgi:hypothetical protein